MSNAHFSAPDLTTFCRLDELGVTPKTVNDAVLAEGRRVLIDDPARFDGVAVVGVDEHCWRHTCRGDKYVTVIIDLTPVRDGTSIPRPNSHGQAGTESQNHLPPEMKCPNIPPAGNLHQ